MLPVVGKVAWLPRRVALGMEGLNWQRRQVISPEDVTFRVCMQEVSKTRETRRET